MTRRDSLRALYDAVRDGGDISWGYAAGPARAALGDAWHTAMDAYCNDMNAALALHNAVLPHIKWELWQSGDAYGCNLTWQNTEYAPNPARALLLADLAAMIQEGEW